MELYSQFKRTQAASRAIARIDESKINAVLNAIAHAARTHSNLILAANQLDLANMEAANPKYDRLKLTAERIEAIAQEIQNVANLSSPLGICLMERTLPNGLQLSKRSVPFGVIGVIYEARPNVSFDVFSLCLKAGSCCVLKGGTDALHSNRAIVKLITQVLMDHHFPADTITLLPPDRAATEQLLGAVGYVDLLIPRGSSGLIHYVREHAKIPVIETGAGVCHLYFDQFGDLEKGVPIIYNAKTRRVSVCNSLDCILIHQSRIADLPALCHSLQEQQVIIFADESAYQALNGHYPSDLLMHATPESYGTEFLSYTLSIKCVPTLEQAIEHIARYGSKHSECIICEDQSAIDTFNLSVDAACVYSNASTGFTDGAQFGLGAEIGISTQKLHARGPMGLNEITTYKWIITGSGQIRE